MADEVKLSDSELEDVFGGTDGNWRPYAGGSYINAGDHIVYSVASGDALSGIAIRFGVQVAEIQAWNAIPNPDIISIGQKLIIYARVLR